MIADNVSHIPCNIYFRAVILHVQWGSCSEHTSRLMLTSSVLCILTVSCKNIRVVMSSRRAWLVCLVLHCDVLTPCKTGVQGYYAMSSRHAWLVSLALLRCPHAVHDWWAWLYTAMSSCHAWLVHVLGFIIQRHICTVQWNNYWRGMQQRVCLLRALL